MLRPLAFAVSLALSAAVCAPAAAQTPPAAKPLRTLVYSLEYSDTTRSEEFVSGLASGSGPSASGPIMGRAETERTASHGDAGTLTANVVAATPDGGLVVDASFAGKDVSQPVVRVAVFPDGRLGVPPGSPLLPAVAHILPLLARGIVAGRTIDVGSTWAMDVPPPIKGTETFKVTAINGNVATFAIALHETVPGPRGFDESGDATAVYDTTKLRPNRVDFTLVSRHTVGTDEYVSTNSRLTVTLVSDTFGM